MLGNNEPGSQSLSHQLDDRERVSLFYNMYLWNWEVGQKVSKFLTHTLELDRARKVGQCWDPSLDSAGWCFVWVSATTGGCALQINTERGGDPGSQLLLPLSSLHPTRSTGPSLLVLAQCWSICLVTGQSCLVSLTQARVWLTTVDNLSCFRGCGRLE